MSIRVVITDDHPIVRDGLRFSIERSKADIVVAGEAGNGRELLDLAVDAEADVYVMDVTMPVMNGIEATRELLRLNPSARVIMLSLQSADSVVVQSLRAGARGFLTKETATRNVVEAIREVHAGRYYLSPEIAHCIVEPFLEKAKQDSAQLKAPRLTCQEMRVLQLFAEGHSSKEIASSLEVSANTVHTHCTSLMAKLGIHDRATLVRYALREGIAKP